MAEATPFAELPPGVFEDVKRLVRSAEQLTIATAIGLFVPCALVFVAAFSALRIVQARTLCKAHPRLRDPFAEFGGLPKSEVRLRAQSDLRLKTILQFPSARVAFWIMLFVPFGYAAFIAAVVALI